MELELQFEFAGTYLDDVSVVQKQSPVTYALDAQVRVYGSSPFTTNHNSPTIIYAYDNAGNRSTCSQPVSYTHNKPDSMLHDLAGNVTNFVRGGVVFDLEWNHAGQLVEVRKNGALAESYAYDALGRRVRTTTTVPYSSTIYHIHNGAQVIADTDANGNVIRSYTWGPGIDNLLAVTVSGGSYYTLTDEQGSVNGYLDYTGVVAHQEFDAWGNRVHSYGNYFALSFPYRWQGREFSEATGFYYFRARWYDPVSSRFLSKDPIGIADGLNLYVFCKNDPVN